MDPFSSTDLITVVLGTSKIIRNSILIGQNLQMHGFQSRSLTLYRRKTIRIGPPYNFKSISARTFNTVEYICSRRLAQLLWYYIDCLCLLGGTALHKGPHHTVNGSHNWQCVHFFCFFIFFYRQHWIGLREKLGLFF